MITVRKRLEWSSVTREVRYEKSEWLTGLRRIPRSDKGLAQKSRYQRRVRLQREGQETFPMYSSKKLVFFSFVWSQLKWFLFNWLSYCQMFLLFSTSRPSIFFPLSPDDKITDNDPLVDGGLNYHIFLLLVNKVNTEKLHPSLVSLISELRYIATDRTGPTPTS